MLRGRFVGGVLVREGLRACQRNRGAPERTFRADGDPLFVALSGQRQIGSKGRRADDNVELAAAEPLAPKILSRQELTGILEPRAAEIAKLVYRDLEKVGLDKEIRSGVVVVGGGAEMDGIVEMVEQVFDQQARKGVPRALGGLSDTVSGPEWAAACGLLLWGLRDQSRVRKRPRKGLSKVADSFKQWFAWT